MPAVRQQTETLQGELLSHRVFGGDHWGFGTVRVRDKGGRRRDVQVTGKLLGVRVGDQVQLEGHWHEHPRYGLQFKVRRCNVAELSGAEGVVKWMASRLPQLGEGRARELVERFGEDLWDVVENDPDRLLEVQGITPARLQAICEAYARHRSERDAMVKLRGWGLTDHQVGQCVGAWGELDEVLRRLQADPYQLSTFVRGFGFVRADAVARKMGVPYDAPARIRAGLEHVLSEGANAGHVFVWGGQLQRMAAELLGVSPKAVGPQIARAAEEGRLVRRGARIYPSRLDRAEAQCAAALRGLLSAGEDAA
ncbi:MAG: hypothetical protein GWN84_20745 [Gammaproteobacteria bacterium]|nr:hypothetical protein [Gammaproteobacteria bacterium]NIR85190.1 hypothetical protein [Gammaproteobacteria bacterium]NIU06239.1 hypothetical protein [Gammaproteobacteria bacterium]NIX87512.1 hypothetical protein [Gammaproteobacteria bacterium]